MKPFANLFKHFIVSLVALLAIPSGVVVATPVDLPEPTNDVDLHPEPLLDTSSVTNSQMVDANKYIDGLVSGSLSLEDFEALDEQSKLAAIKNLQLRREQRFVDYPDSYSQLLEMASCVTLVDVPTCLAGAKAATDAREETTRHTELAPLMMDLTHFATAIGAHS